MTRLRALWRGDLPLAEAFWTWTVAIGLLVNITTTILFLTFLTLDRPWMALCAGYVPSVPYNIVAVVGVWRSAERDQGPGLRADLARGASIVLMAVLSLT
ncbi:hypothetical protein PANO111632_00320 [Paracoccus nototheniae]|uniref:Uncharacterized protein n=1 Tax=Paracoccus nototheniae TaxID=2489002 RepID=A0ABW4DZA3_9RHOB|nr:hypothetical protein [Paracoccus nototheniae]